MMELMHKNIAIGKIEITGRENFWIFGDFYPYPIASDLLNEENWFVRENGNSKGISCPAIYDNCQIGFRYR